MKVQSIISVSAAGLADTLLLQATPVIITYGWLEYPPVPSSIFLQRLYPPHYKQFLRGRES